MNMIKHYAMSDYKCDYCGEGCSHQYVIRVGKEIYSGHKHCIEKLQKECEEAWHNYMKERNNLLYEGYEQLIRKIY